MADETTEKEPLILWWMPFLAVAAPIVFAAWKAASADDHALSEAAVAFLWPGVLLYAGAVAVLWAGWKLDLE